MTTPTTTIVLNDIPGSVATYLEENVTVDVAQPRTGTSSVLQPGDEATFTITLTNKGAIRLVNVRYHLTIDDATVAQFLSVHNLVATSRADFGEPVFTQAGTQTPTLLVEPFITTLNVLEPNGGQLTSPTLTIHLRTKGATTIKAHMHGDIDQTTLFPTAQRGDATPVDIKVK
jgi:uncharacterized repeat protein (TIGR01451 family)